ncbi:MAG: nucleotidyltransferase family protein [Acidobacteriota bacterium]
MDRLRELVAQPFDGDRLTTLAIHHEVHPLVDRVLNRLGLGQSPTWRQHLAEACKESLARNLILEHELDRILPVMAAAGVRVLSVKGPRFARDVYGGIALRTSRDLDLFIPETQLPQAVDILGAHDYRLWPPLRRQDIEQLRRFEKAIILRGGRGPFPVFVDLHWNFAPPELGLRVDLDGLWRRVRNSGVGDTAMGREDLLLFLLVHGHRHLWNRLKLVSDIDAYLCCFGHRLDWERLAHTTSAWKIDDIVERGLRLATTLLETELPSVAAVCLHNDHWLVDPLAEPATFLASGRNPRCAPVFAWLQRLRQRRGPLNLARHIVGSCRPNLADFTAWPWGRRMVPTLWLLRPLRLLMKSLR